MAASRGPGGSDATAPLTIVAVYAHPDDGEFFCAGSLARWAAEGHRVHAICATDGALGTRRNDATRESIAATRAAELTRAMRTIGGQPPIMLGYPDGALREHAQPLRERLVYWLRKLRADRVLTFDPWKKYEIHPDHIEVGRMASEAAVFACFPLLHPEHLADGVAAVQPSEVWYMTPTEHRPNRVVDIATTFQTKVDSVLCHESQVEMLANWFVPGADPANLSAEHRTMLREGTAKFLEQMARGQAQGAQGVTLAEAFFVQRCGSGHFENYPQMIAEAWGVAPADPSVE